MKKCRFLHSLTSRYNGNINLMLTNFKIKSRMGQAKQTHRSLTYLFIDGCAPASPILHDCLIVVTEKSRWVLSFKTQPNFCIGNLNKLVENCSFKLDTPITFIWFPI